MTWGPISDRMLTAIFRSRLIRIPIAQGCSLTLPKRRRLFDLNKKVGFYITFHGCVFTQSWRP